MIYNLVNDISKIMRELIYSYDTALFQDSIS